MENKEGCESCKAYKYEDQDAIFCQLPNIKDGVECPCLNCLVKVICGDTNCKRFQDYLYTVWGDSLRAANKGEY